MISNRPLLTSWARWHRFVRVDLLAKTPATEIHLFDGDVFMQHNVFRAPGVLSLAELETQLARSNAPSASTRRCTRRHHDPQCDLNALIVELGFDAVHTVLASGNVLFGTIEVMSVRCTCAFNER